MKIHLLHICYLNLVQTLDPCLESPLPFDDGSDFSGGAVFHTGSLRVVDTSFVANQAVLEGPSIISVGLLRQLSNITFSENVFHCPANKYSYIVKTEARKTVSLELTPFFMFRMGHLIA